VSWASKPLCAETSLAHAEPVGATASRVDRWILLEYRGVWAHDAVDGSILSKELKAFLRAERGRLPHARVLFVRSGERRGRDGLLAFFGRTTADESELRRLELDRLDDLIGLDLETAGTLVEHPLFLVCTHGKHDRCCAKYGRPLYDAVREQVEAGWVWQSTHVGGDRFAGNLVALPDGVYYGRVEPAEAWPVLEASLAGRVHLPCYRGRSCYGFAAQAAELRVREGTGLLGISAVRVRSIERSGDGWRAEVDAGGTVYDVEVRREEGEPTHLTCSTATLRRPSHYVAGSLRARAS
jgi:hypothetical protein